MPRKASAAQRAEREARGIKTELPDIYDETTDGRELLAAAVTKAKQEEKRVLLIWGANWCTPCHLLEQFIERSPDVTEVLESRYIVVHMDIGRHDRNLGLREELELPSPEFNIPQLTIVDATGAKVAHSERAPLMVPGEGGRFVDSSDRFVRFLDSSTP